MASINGKTTLVDKIKAIAGALRNKTKKSDKLTMTKIVEEIINEWKITCFVKVLDIKDNGIPEGENNNDDWKYVHKNLGGRINNGIVLSYTPENDVVLTVATNDGGYENVIWNIASAPEGSNLSIYTKQDWKQWSSTGNFGSYQSCIIKGIDHYCQILVECGTTDGD